MVGRYTDVSRSCLDQLEHGAQHRRSRALGPILPLFNRLTVEVVEELVGTVDEMGDRGKSRDGHGCARLGVP
jgi:hypothetical protein